MRYRWRENVWGNQYSTCADLMAKRIGTGTAEDPYLVEWYYLVDKSYYPANVNKPDEVDLATAQWIKLEQTAEYKDGYIKRIAMDKRYPHVITPVESAGADSATYYSDYAYHVNTPVVRAVRLGGDLAVGAYAGLLFFHAHYAPSVASWLFGGGLYFSQ